MGNASKVALITASKGIDIHTKTRTEDQLFYQDFFDCSIQAALQFVGNHRSEVDNHTAQQTISNYLKMIILIFYPN